MPATLRRTRRLLAQLPSTGDATPPATTALGDWYVDRIHLGHAPYLLAVSETTYLAIVLHVRDVRMVPSRFPAEVAARLPRLDIPADMIARETTAMVPMAVGATASRRVLGVMREFADTAYAMHDDGELTADGWGTWLEDELAGMPLFASRRADEVVFPQQAVLVAMMARWAAG